jgi:hypothetical protein
MDAALCGGLANALLAKVDRLEVMMILPSAPSPLVGTAPRPSEVIQEVKKMKRDMDLVRSIILACSEHEHGFAPDFQIDGYSTEQVEYHKYLMVEAGLLQGKTYSVAGSETPVATVSAMTWEGHDFLEASRDDKIWAKAKQATSAAGGMAFDVLKTILSGLATQAAKNFAGLP